MGKNLVKFNCRNRFLYSIGLVRAIKQVTITGLMLGVGVWITQGSLKSVRAGESSAGEKNQARIRQHLSIENVYVERVTDPDGFKVPSEIFANPSQGDDGEVILDKIFNIGKKIWSVIDAGRPVVNMDFDFASALPSGVSGPASLEGWMEPQSVAYRIQTKNGFGATTVDFTYRIVFISGGRFRDQGRYLARVAVYPQDLWVAWGYSFHAGARVPEGGVVNVGTRTDPVGAVQLDVNWKIATPITQLEGSGNYFIKGTGEFKNLTTQQFDLAKDSLTSTNF